MKPGISSLVCPAKLASAFHASRAILSPLYTFPDTRAFPGKLFSVLLEIVPEGKTTALIGPDLVDGAFFPTVIEKNTCIIAVNIPLFEGQPIVYSTRKAMDEVNIVDIEKVTYTPDIMFTDPDVAGTSPAAESLACITGLGVKTKIESGLLYNRHRICSSRLTL